ncbi:amylopullulanase [Halanaerobium sp. Z-7514]|uniref:Amylopullulanase n=1 Tax=Halanaerobium polyolivorans TaxID=2886943 RepID=A0AAW4WTM5_9FIRM|nr:glucodextranase DOMON-like domain-containing protein [Halanaerobium polyolivorans]MCC3144445.1 amylopullulanase [Halanaerobium polyolivorans]RQD79071.1 MAG: amylopullulanase [Halanaerobium sp. MSAO_Bac5]
MTLISRKIWQIIFFLSIVIFLISFLMTAVYAAEYRVVFNHLDARGDDFGPGNYEYPLNHIFHEADNIFDIQALTIFESEHSYRFRFSFGSLTDPWNSEYGFSLPLIELYIDNQNSGANQPFHEGANITFAEDFNWNKFLKISGWWARLYTPESEEEFLDLNELALDDKHQAQSAEILRDGDDLYLTLAKSELGSLDNSSVVLLIGSFDPFGFDYYRDLSRRRQLWKIYTETDLDLDKAPRVMDILTPGPYNQRNILNNELAEVPAIRVKAPLPERRRGIIEFFMIENLLIVFAFLIYLALIKIIAYKFDYNK